MTRTLLLTALIAAQLACSLACSQPTPEVASAQPAKPAPEPVPLPPNASAQAKLVDAYLRVSDRLASDDAKGAAGAAAKAAEAAGSVEGQQPAQIKAAAAEIAAASDIEKQRAAFERASNALIGFVESAGNPMASIVYVARCPMAFDNRGARWLQGSAAIRNPYFGASMLTCGSIEAQYAPGARKP